MIESPTQFAWHAISGWEYLPPEPKRGSRYGPDSRCWLCGGETNGIGWPLKEALASTFTNHNSAKVLVSTTVCQPCSAFSACETWVEYVTSRELPLKIAHPISWRSYSHVFAPGHHECPNRARWREVLLSPPEPPFLLVCATSGQKHLIFRGRVGHSRLAFPVQFEDEQLWVRREEFAALLAEFERLYLLGFSKDQILTGDYNQAQVLKVGIGAWREAEESFAPWRSLAPQLVRLAHFCAQLPEGEREARELRAKTPKPKPEPRPKRAPAVAPPRAQETLF